MKEIIIVDTNSIDHTISIASKYTNKIIKSHLKPLGARIEGSLIAKGECVFFIDSDQVLSSGLLEECVEKIASNDFLIVKESSNNQPGLFIAIQKLERDYINDSYLNNKSPSRGSLFPRFFRRELLIESLKQIPTDLWNIHAFEDVIRYYEISKLSNNVELTERVLFHNEEKNISTLFRHFYYYGKDFALNHSALRLSYPRILRNKTKFRAGLFKNTSMKIVVATVLIQVIRGLGFYCGFFFNRRKG